MSTIFGDIIHVCFQVLHIINSFLHALHVAHRKNPLDFACLAPSVVTAMGWDDSYVVVIKHRWGQFVKLGFSRRRWEDVSKIIDQRDSLSKVKSCIFTALWSQFEFKHTCGSWKGLGTFNAWSCKSYWKISLNKFSKDTQDPCQQPHHIYIDYIWRLFNFRTYTMLLLWQWYSVQQILRVISKPMNKESIYTHVWFLTSKGILVPQELLSYMGHSVALSEGRSNVD